MRGFADTTGSKAKVIELVDPQDFKKITDVEDRFIVLDFYAE